jgi:hypothetical protein
MTPEMERALRLNPRLRKRLRCARAGSPRQVRIARIASGGVIVAITSHRAEKLMFPLCTGSRVELGKAVIIPQPGLQTRR